MGSFFRREFVVLFGLVVVPGVVAWFLLVVVLFLLYFGLYLMFLVLFFTIHVRCYVWHNVLQVQRRKVLLGNHPCGAKDWHCSYQCVWAEHWHSAAGPSGTFHFIYKHHT